MNHCYRKYCLLPMLLQLAALIILLAADQISKRLALVHLCGKPDIVLMKNVLALHYLENTGAAFGIFRGRQWIFYILSVIILAVLVYVYVRIYKNLAGYISLKETDSSSYNRRYIRNTVLLGSGLCVLAAGAAGNMIDRIFYGYVIDFIEVRFISFPVFNLADIYVTISCIFIVIFFLFLYRKEDDFKII